LNFQDEDGKTPLHIAIEKERLSVIVNILSAGARLDLVDKDGQNSFHYAAKINREIIEKLCLGALSRQLFPTDASSSESNQQQPSIESPVQLSQLLNCQNASHQTPLYIACTSDKPDCVRELLKYGANMNSASLNYQPSENACDLKDTKLIAKLNDKEMKNGGSPLHWCKAPEDVETLVEANCAIDATDFQGNTALHMKISQSNLLYVMRLLSYGADVNAIGAGGCTPLHLAVKTNDITFVQAILVFGANLDTLTAAGESARHLAATSKVSPSKDVILYMLNSIGSKRCSSRRITCAEGCSVDFTYNGVPPENRLFLRNAKLYSPLLIEPIVKNAVEQAKAFPQSISEELEEKPKLKLLALDGGGIRGLILIQILAFLEKELNRPVTEMFDYIAGTSTGGILTLLLADGYSGNLIASLFLFIIDIFICKVQECRQIYFRLKDKIFKGIRPYVSDTLEQFLQKFVGEDKRMRDLSKPKLVVFVIYDVSISIIYYFDLLE